MIISGSSVDYNGLRSNSGWLVCGLYFPLYIGDYHNHAIGESLQSHQDSMEWERDFEHCSTDMAEEAKTWKHPQQGQAGGCLRSRHLRLSFRESWTLKTSPLWFAGHVVIWSARNIIGLVEGQIETGNHGFSWVFTMKHGVFLQHFL